jgi:hypothetical protein
MLQILGDVHLQQIWGSTFFMWSRALNGILSHYHAFHCHMIMFFLNEIYLINGVRSKRVREGRSGVQTGQVGRFVAGLSI